MSSINTSGNHDHKFSRPFLILLNGPSNCGKDYLAKAILDHGNYSADHHKIIEPARIATGVFMDKTSEWIELHKDELQEGYQCTPRKMIIDLANKVRDICGKDIFGRIAAADVVECIKIDANFDDPRDLFIFSDIGYTEETEAVCKLFDRERILLLRIEREGKTFSDGRHYIALPGVHVLNVANRGDDFIPYCMSAIHQWVHKVENDYRAQLAVENRGEL
jgi:hypothetical protein